MKPLALITGVGPGTGAAMKRRFTAGGYRVAMLARSAERLAELEKALPESIAIPCDVADPLALDAALTRLDAEHGLPKVVVHNAVGGAFGNFLQVEPAVLEANFQVNVMALLRLARRYADALAAAEGALIVTGNTSALRGKANFAGFAPTKAAQRILAESIAREMGPKGLHVAYLMIDAVIDVPWTRARMPDRPDDFFIKPSAIAEEAFHLAHQDGSAWTFLAEVRPFGETW
jgi:NAD(P)-dependent dehydrogenase (short-subunit alcohol dehydrogenase family)